MKINETDKTHLIVLAIFCFKIHNQVLYTADTEIEGRKVTSQILTRPGYKAKQIWLPRHNIASDFILKRLKTVLQGTLIFIKKE